MAAFTTIAAVASLALGAASFVSQRRAAKKAASNTKKARATQQRIADQKAARDRTRAVREARVKRAQLQVRAEGAGVAGASGAVAGEQSITSQLASNLGFSQQIQGLGQQATAFNQQAASAQGQAATAGAIGGVAQSIFQTAGGFKTIFNAI